MHTRLSHATGTQRRDGQRWWCLPWSLLAVLTLGLALATSPRVHAETFKCAVGDVYCLITAINTANANGQTNTIRLAAGTYTLTKADNGTTGDTNGLPVITSTVTIQGAGAAATSIERDTSSPEVFRFLTVAPTGTLMLKGLTLRSGLLNSGDGSGIYNTGTLTLTNCALTDNGTYYGGGGLANSGTLTIMNSTVTGNNGSRGGGLANSGTLMITNSTVEENSAYSGGGLANSGTLTIMNSTVARNTTNNNYDGGGITNTGTLTIMNSNIAENRGYNGGGIANSGTLTLTSSTVAENTARHFGGGLLGGGTITNSIFIGNRAPYGGGILYVSSSGDLLEITRSTIAGNYYEGILVFLFGSGPEPTLTHVTFEDNGYDYRLWYL